jgi:hypothetical protein
MIRIRLNPLWLLVLTWPLTAVAADQSGLKPSAPKIRRVLYNLDGGSCMWTKKNGKMPVQVTPDDLKTVVDEIAFPGSKVDTLLVCINAQCMDCRSLMNRGQFDTRDLISDTTPCAPTPFG